MFLRIVILPGKTLKNWPKLVQEAFWSPPGPSIPAQSGQGIGVIWKKVGSKSFPVTLQGRVKCPHMRPKVPQGLPGEGPNGVGEGPNGVREASWAVWGDSKSVSNRTPE